MARNTMEAWIPEEYGGAVIQRVERMSAVEALGRPEPMGTDTRHVPRAGEVDVEFVAKGAAYNEDQATNDEVLLTARKFGKVIRIADEDLQDTTGNVNVLETKKVDWATSYGKFFDNATLAVTAAENGTTVPFTSVYKAVRTSNAATGYTADNNYVSGTAATYSLLSSTLGKVEGGDYFDLGEVVVIAHPAFRGLLRGILDAQNRPIFMENGGNNDTPETLFGVPIRWSLGAKTSATATKAPTGNPLLIIANKNLLIVGKRSGPESVVAGADTGAAFLTDEALLKLRARRGFAVGNENGVAVFEKLP